MDKPTPGALYQGYSKGDAVDAETVKALFVRKFGHEPAEVHDAVTVWLCGPVGGDAPVTEAGRLSDIVDTLIDDGAHGQLSLWG
jgi:hypothetical protein